MKSTAEQIVEPMEIIWKKLVDLSKDGKIVSASNASNAKLFAIVQEMDVTLSFLRRDVEGILEPEELLPDDFYENYRSEEDLVEEDLVSNQEPSIWESFTREDGAEK